MKRHHADVLSVRIVASLDRGREVGGILLLSDFVHSVPVAPRHRSEQLTLALRRGVIRMQHAAAPFDVIRWGKGRALVNAFGTERVTRMGAACE